MNEKKLSQKYRRRHCEPRSGEAIQVYAMPDSGLLRANCPRNDGCDIFAAASSFLFEK
jgi:hypothetical protein